MIKSDRNLGELLRTIDYNDVSLDSPTVLNFKLDNGLTYLCTVCKDVINTVHMLSDIKLSTSKDVYSKSVDIWKELVSLQKGNTYIGYYSSNKVISPYVVGISEDDITDSLKTFCSTIDKYNHNIFISSERIKIHIDISSSKFAIIDLNFGKRYYRLSTGIKTESEDILITAPSIILEGTLSDFLNCNIEYELNMLKKLPEYYEYDANEASKIELSLREILDIIKLSNIPIDISKEGLVESDIVPMRLVKYFNSTGKTFKTLKKLSYLDKSITFSDNNKITLSDMVSMLSTMFKNIPYMSIDGLVEVLRIYNNMTSDHKVIEDFVEKHYKVVEE